MISSETKSSDITETDNLSFSHKLRNIVDKIQLTPNLIITHPDYEPLEISAHHQEYLKQVSLPDQDRYLVTKLQQYLYDIFNDAIILRSNDTKDTTRNSERNSDSNNADDHKQIANYVRKWSKTKFYQQLTQHNHGQGYSDPNWLVVKQESPNLWQITKNGLRLHIKPKKHLTDHSRELQAGQLVSLKMPSNLVDHGLYIAVGNAGSTNNSDSLLDSTVVQLYFNTNPEGALLLLDRFTQELNTLQIPFDFKIAYDVADFIHADATILEFKSVDFDLLLPILKSSYQENQTYFQPQIPFFCKHLASGLGLAEKPISTSSSEPENIGLHTCGIIAKALLIILKYGGYPDLGKLDYLLDFLTQEGIDLNYLYLNPQAKDIYETLYS